jgi:hypothetical protein
MSLPNITGTARLLTDPRRRLTSTQKPMASALLLFQGWKKDSDGKWIEGDSLAVDAVAFEDPARILAQCAKGDHVEITEAVATGIEVWNDRPRLKIRIDVCRGPVEVRTSATRAVTV